ncbi:hybrid cluster protein [Halanaerobium hydrogeniformans]|uniref:Hydroxylamine reductase n=2 Tax=Halanaerobium hydrogeniformans TaxID=656519 RepID=E4RN31_HALHG|nr:hydroxylamine reductase [Halanaerobium hydrogeniformans]ADQ14248.1 hybrid cluster protein [Halanaerobium hydrogeniformans]
MSMFCYQCQETAKNEGCTVRGVCGKDADVANLQDLLIFVLKGVSVYAEKAKEEGIDLSAKTAPFIMEGLFATITNANFDAKRFEDLIVEAFSLRDEVKAEFEKAYQKNHGEEFDGELPEHAVWTAEEVDEYYTKGEGVGVLETDDVDLRSLRELATYGLKGIAAYGDHARVLGKHKEEIDRFTQKVLAATTDDSLSVDELVGLVMETGEKAVETMALLDEANTSTYGHPEPTEVNIGVNDNPGILISGHDLKDMEELLEQTEGTGVDVYTHSEMLPANSYPAFKKYDHFVGNYGNSWWKQDKEFEQFNGPILMTTNCITPVKDSYKDRIFTTGMAGYPGVTHIPDREEGGSKDFSEIIELAKTCDSPVQLEEGTIPGGYARNTVMSVADKVIEAVENGDISRFVVMGGCDGRFKSRDYFTDVAKELPEDAVILTAGCAKYRYNKLDLGDIGGIPRVLDAGQCNDSYSLAYIALQLKEALDLDDINELPISYDIAWYEQKAVAVLLALLSLGVKGIRLGPTLPAFVSENVLNVLVDKFDIKPTTDAESDVAAIMAGE